MQGKGTGHRLHFCTMALIARMVRIDNDVRFKP